MEKIDQILDSLYSRVIEPEDARKELFLLSDVRRMLIDFCQSQEAYKIHTSDVEMEKGIDDYLKSINFV